ncbi:MAG TPA: hypothetical protein VH640_25550 [Bryobacteraceae bacterium]|jgi:hypothetical protein
MLFRIRTLVLVLAAASPLLAQTAKPGGKPWTAPRTADGQPDLQGTWTDATITPFERPAPLASTQVLSPAEAAKLEKQAAAANSEEAAPKPGDVGSYNEFWFDRGTKVVKTRQASLVVDPPDGRVPVTAAAEAKRDYNIAHNTDSYEYMSTWDRCITRGVPGDMFPAGYNNSYQILQTPGYVVILAEMIHDARVIPLDGRPHLPAGVGQWNGDSRGHWEGNTLVIDTTNFNGKGWIASNAASGRIKGIPESPAAHIVERFTRTDADTILYEATIDDPQMYAKPWKVSIPLSRDPEYVIYEYACHEGNYAMVDILNGGRAQEKAADQK